MMGAGGARQGILSLAIKDKNGLYNAFLSFIKGGGIFVPTAKRYSLGDEVFVLMTLPRRQRAPAGRWKSGLDHPRRIARQPPRRHRRAIRRFGRRRSRARQDRSVAGGDYQLG